MAPSFAATATPLPPFPIDNHSERKPSMWPRFSFSKVGQWLGREDSSPSPLTKPNEEAARPSLSKRLSKRIVPGLPRSPTEGQLSEQRQNLVPQPRHVERRAISVDRRRAVSSRRASSPVPVAISRVSAPEVSRVQDGFITDEEDKEEPIPSEGVEGGEGAALEHPNTVPFLDGCSEVEARSEAAVDENMITELEDKWILNLSMHFRDRSNREKFFITYAEPPNRWRRVTVSCDYRESPPDSLESDLQELSFQREKSARIYESIRESLPDIQFYETVTNLKLKTEDGRLHVHVTEDVNEIVPFPSVSTVRHLGCEQIRESDLNFDSHLSGFVYKVKIESQLVIKKEIPGPDTVDEFLYEINALHALSGSRGVIGFRGVVVDDLKEIVKGLLISFAEQGALVDLIYDMKGQLPWKSRERWAKQIVHGLAEIHEAGFVQGDFTLSNIVIDGQDNAKIIDINRRGCPVGWEPPEMTKLIETGQRISMYIGVKSDLYQLGMVLWALAQEEDEPERQERPLSLTAMPDDIPHYYREVVALCLKPQPQQRPSAGTLLSMFPLLNEDPIRPNYDLGASLSNPSEKQYIDPITAVEREDIARFRSHRNPHGLDGADADADADADGEPANSTGDHTYVNSPSVDSYDLRFENSNFTRRGRQPPTNTLDLDPSYNNNNNNNNNHQQHKSSPTNTHPRPGSVPSDHGPDTETPQIIPISPSDEHKWDEVNLDGHPYLIQRHLFELDDLDDELPGAQSSEARGAEERGGREGAERRDGAALTAVALGPLTGDLAGVGGGVEGLD